MEKLVKARAEDKIMLQIRLTPDMDRRLRRIAFELDLSRNKAVNQAIESWVQRQEEQVSLLE